MVTKYEYLLDCLKEECAEVIHRATKVTRFGLGEVEPGQRLNNQERLCGELNDLMGVLRVLQEARVLPTPWVDPVAIEAKMTKIDKFMQYSQKIGTLETL